MRQTRWTDTWSKTTASMHAVFDELGGLALSRERVHDPRQQRTLAGVVQGGLWSSSLGVVEDHRIGIISCRRDVAREEQGLLKVRTSRTGCVEPFPAKTPPVLGPQLLIEGLSRLSRNQVIRCLAHLGAVISAGSCHGEENVPETCPKTATVLMQAQRASREDPTPSCVPLVLQPIRCRLLPTALT